MDTFPVATLKEANQSIADGIANVMTGLGTNRDRSTSTTAYKTFGWNPEEMESYYSENAIARKVVDIPIEDSLRKWRKFDDSDVELSKIEEYEEREKELEIEKHIGVAMRWASVHGGGAIIPVYRGVTDAMLEDEFDVEMMRPGKLERFVVMDARNIYPDGTIEQNPLKEGYLMPIHYRLTGSNARIHHSWVIRAEGLPLPRQDFQRNRWWGQSRLASIRDDVNRALMVRGAMSQLLDETNLDIFSVENLAAAFSAGGEAGLRNRVEALAILKSTYKVVLKDTTEKFERAQISVSGFSEILGMFYGIVAAMADIPVTRFMGTAAKGLNATGEGDMRNYYDMIAAKQVKELKPILAKLDAIIHQDMGHGAKTKWKYSFPSLWQEPETEKESRLLTRSQRDQIYMQAGVVTAEIVAKELRQDKVYSFLDEAHIKRVGKLEKEMDEAEHEAMVAGFENAAKGEFSNAGATPAKSGMPSVKPALKTQYDPNDSTKR